MVSPDTSINPVYAEGNGRISTYAVTLVNPTVSLAIGGDATNKQVITSPGSVGYRSHTVTVEAHDIESYSLIISGPTNLTSGTSTLVSGAGGKTPAAMSDNTWGYSWGDTSTTKESSTYQSLTTNGNILTGDRISNFGVNFTRNLFFAAKFSEDADSGRYRANVTLSLAATPRAIATGFGSIRDMQDMTPEICNAATIGDSGSLEDIRDGSVYTVAKLSDGNCWMAQNLRLPGGTSMNRTNTDLDPTVYATDSQTYTLPATSSTFSNTKTSDSAGNSTYMNHQVYNATDNDYGAYYSWCAATAGTCQIGTYANIQPALNSTDNVYYTASPADTTAVSAKENATSSICPKGWRLPTGGSNGEYQTLYNKWTTATWNDASGNKKAGRMFGAGTEAAGGAFFPAAGYVNTSGISTIGLYGLYWSSTVYSVTNGYNLRFNSSNVNPADYNSRYLGYSVRCVAEKPAAKTWDTITVMQEMTPEICAQGEGKGSKTLTDSRDQSTYTVQRLSDGKCWMTQNLRIVNYPTKADDSQTGSFTIPASAASGFTGTDNNAAYYSGDTAYGAYYSWYTATAGTGTSSVSSGDATGSICPKNWRLPTKTEYETLYGKGKSGWTANGGKNGYWVGAANATGGAFFPAAGGYKNSSPNGVGSFGLYWSSTAIDGSTAYSLGFGSGGLGTDYDDKYYGGSVRCVAQ